MDARELRIGNFLKHYKNIAHVTWGVIKDVELGERNYEPIELTEEWLEKFGFEKDEHFDVDKNDEWIASFEILLYFKEDKSINSYIFWDKRDGCHLQLGGELDVALRHFPNIKYVHQLQNLYFALTGKELE